VWLVLGDQFGECVPLACTEMPTSLNLISDSVFAAHVFASARDENDADSGA
jgi:hypothetical protein